MKEDLIVIFSTLGNELCAATIRPALGLFRMVALINLTYLVPIVTISYSGLSDHKFTFEHC
jgi:hypothetical protein